MESLKWSFARASGTASAPSKQQKSDKPVRSLAGSPTESRFLIDFRPQ